MERELKLVDEEFVCGWAVPRKIELASDQARNLRTLTFAPIREGNIGQREKGKDSLITQVV